MTRESSRREFLFGASASLGSIALTAMLKAEEKVPPSSFILPPSSRSMHKPKAKAIIMLFMEGGPSHIDTFDPKTALTKLHLSESTRTNGLATGKRFYVGSPFKARKVGKSGIEMSDQWKFLADPKVADELCVYRGCKAESLNHPEALLHMNTGSRLGGDPGVGAWATYGLGSENQNLPGYVVMTELALPQAGPANWSNGFLPGHFQGTRLRSTGSPILDLNPPSYKTRDHQRKALDQLALLNADHAKNHPEHSELAARMESYELAYRMQMSVPGIIDIDNETQHVQQAYGLDRKATAAFGRQCLMARRLVEKGVRFVQIFSGGWDSHDYLEQGHSSRIASVDQPIAALIKDLNERGLLDDTLVVWTGEFGRTPDNNYRGGVTSLGRGHNADAMNMWFAGGGTKAGSVVGATDEIGAEAVEVVHPIRDVHITMLHLLGLDDNKLTYFHAGRYKQLSQFGGELIPEIIA
jgi:hypothetical protein